VSRPTKTLSRPSRPSQPAEALAEQGLSAPRDVTPGEETLDEICLGIFGMAQKVSDLLQ
jgi:hypothetical protein